jgi:hypothetical protein
MNKFLIGFCFCVLVFTYHAQAQTISKTRISHLACPVTQTEYWRNGQRGLPLPCWVVDAYEAKLVDAGYCLRRFADFEGKLGSPFWQQCQSPSTQIQEAAKDGSLCFGGHLVCSPAPGYPFPPWGHENLPCPGDLNSITHRITYYDSNDPRFVLGCAAGATMVMQVRQGEYGKPSDAMGTPTNLMPPPELSQRATWKMEVPASQSKAKYSPADLARDAAAAGMSEEQLSAIQNALAPAPPEETAAGLIAQQQFLLRQKNNKTVLMPGSKQDQEFARGRSDRTAWEQWFNNLQGSYKIGAFYWSEQRHLSQASCAQQSPQLSVDFLDGCKAAKARLTPTDIARKTSPSYKLGWNSYTEASLAESTTKNTQTLVVCLTQPCGPLPDDGQNRNSYLVLQSFPEPDPQRKCDTAIYGLSGCKLYHQKSIGNGWMEIIP